MEQVIKRELKSIVGDSFEEYDDGYFLDLNYSFTDELSEEITQLINTKSSLDERYFEIFVNDFIDENLSAYVDEILKKYIKIAKNRKVVELYNDNDLVLNNDLVEEMSLDTNESLYSIENLTKVVLREMFNHELFANSTWLYNVAFSAGLVDYTIILAEVEKIFEEKIRDRDNFIEEVLNYLKAEYEKIDINSLESSSMYWEIKGLEKELYNQNYKRLVEVGVEVFIYDNLLSVTAGKSVLFNDGKTFFDAVKNYLMEKTEDFTFTVKDFIDYVDCVDDFLISRETMEIFVTDTNEVVKENFFKFCYMCIKECDDVISVVDVLNALTMKWFNKSYEDYCRIVNIRLSKGILPKDGSFSEYLSQNNEDYIIDDEVVGLDYFELADEVSNGRKK